MGKIEFNKNLKYEVLCYVESIITFIAYGFLIIAAILIFCDIIYFLKYAEIRIINTLDIFAFFSISIDNWLGVVYLLEKIPGFVAIIITSFIFFYGSRQL